MPFSQHVASTPPAIFSNRSEERDLFHVIISIALPPLEKAATRLEKEKEEETERERKEKKEKKEKPFYRSLRLRPRR